MTYDFDEIVPRRGTDSMKHDRVEWCCSRGDALPMWVADMDFRTPPFVLRAIERRLRQGVLGYTCSSDTYWESVCRWNREQYGHEVARGEVCYVPGVVCGIYLCLQAFTEKSDKVLIQDPVYHPFRLVPEACGREVVMSPLRRTEESFAMDFDTLRRDIQGCRMMILCNPHNPGGVCWSRDDLRRVASICAEAGAVLVSDEIHCDMTLGGRRHTALATVSEEARLSGVTLQAPSKTFNMPGVVASQAIVHDKEKRDRLFRYVEGTDMDLGSVFAYDCVAACYSPEGLEWKTQMLRYVEGNIDLLCRRLERDCPGVRAMRPQAGYLVFLDCRGLGLQGQEELERLFADKARLALNSGVMFGRGGRGYMRMNVGCPRSVVSEAADRLTAALRA